MTTQYKQNTKFGFILQVDKGRIRSDEELTLETSAFQIFYGGNSTLINLFDKTKYSCFTLPSTQHHNITVSLETRNLFTI